MTAEPAGVEVAGVGKSFGDRPVLDDVNLAVPAGAITAVLGPSGCGKTTLLRIIAGFEDADTAPSPWVDVPWIRFRHIAVGSA